jgi:hypothetical protein
MKRMLEIMDGVHGQTGAAAAAKTAHSHHTPLASASVAADGQRRVLGSRGAVGETERVAEMVLTRLVERMDQYR